MKLVFSSLFACLFVCRVVQALVPVPQGFPVVWNGDRYFKYPGEIVQAPPTWLDGYLFAQLSASYGDPTNPKGQYVRHTFDAIAAMAQIDLNPYYTTYTGAYYPSRAYKIWNLHDRDFTKSSVAWMTAYSTWNVTALKLWQQVPIEGVEHAPNVDFWKIGHSVIAATEFYNVGLTFDLETTDHFRPYPFVEGEPNMQSLSMIPIHLPVHERVDPDTNLIWSTVLALKVYSWSYPTLHQVVFTVDQTGERIIRGVYDYAPVEMSKCVKGFYTGDKKGTHRYMHSITSTQNYVILPLTSSALNPCALFAKKDGPKYPDGTILYDPTTGLDWVWKYDQSAPLTFLVFDKRTNEFLPPIETDLHRFISHQVNAYELTDKKLVLDMIGYEEDAYEVLTLDFMLNPGDKAALLDNHPTRFIVDLEAKTVEHRPFTPKNKVDLEFPQFNHNFEGKKYKYAYLIEHVFFADTALVKVDMDDPSGDNNVEFKPKTSVSLAEPYFVARPGATEEDDGVLVLRALDLGLNTTRVYVVDAKTMQQVGEFLEPVLTPFGFHERFYTKESLGLKKATKSDAHTSRGTCAKDARSEL